MPDDFTIAVERARERVGERLWTTMSTRAQSLEIYLELRALDVERAARSAAKPTAPGGDGRSS